MNLKIDWEQVRAEAELEHRLRRMRWIETEVVAGDGNTKVTDDVGAGDDETTEKPSPVPIGLGHPPSFTLTDNQVKDHPFRFNTSVRVGCHTGVIINVGIWLGDVRDRSNRGLFCNVHFIDLNVTRWIDWEDLSVLSVV